MKLMIVGEAWGMDEDRLKLPFVGASGKMLAKVLEQAGIARVRWFKDDWDQWHPDWQSSQEVYVTNCFNLRPHPSNDVSNLCVKRGEADILPGYPALAQGRYIPLSLKDEIDRLWEEIRIVKPNLILALGNTPLKVLTRKPHAIGLVRGTMFQLHTGHKMLPTYHPSAVGRDPSHRPIFMMDLYKAARHVGSPEYTRPKREIWIRPTLEDMQIFAMEYMDECFWGDQPCGVDIETEMRSNTITEIGLSPDPAHALVVPFHSRETPTGNYWPSLAHELAAWEWVIRVLELLKVPVCQNGLFDVANLWSIGIKTWNADEDTMLLHHALQPELKKSLAFLASIYTDEPRWKFMRKSRKKEDA